MHPANARTTRLIRIRGSKDFALRRVAKANAAPISATTADTYGAVVVRTIPSIAGTDAWHFRKGYVKRNRVAESFVFSHADGPICQMGSHKPES